MYYNLNIIYYTCCTCSIHTMDTVYMYIIISRPGSNCRIVVDPLLKRNVPIRFPDQWSFWRRSGKFGSLVKVGKLCGWFLLDFFFIFTVLVDVFFVLCFHFPVIKNEGTFYPVVNDRRIVFQLFFWMPEMRRKIWRFGTNHFWFGESWSLDIQGSITVSIKCHPFFGGIKQFIANIWEKIEAFPLKSALF